MPNTPPRQFGHAYWAIWPISLRLRGAIVLLDGKANEERKEAMIARFDHRPMLTAALALSTTVLIVVVITLAALLFTEAPPAATSSGEGGANPGAAAAVPGTGGEFYGEGWNNYGHDVVPPQPAKTGDSVEPHQGMPSAHYGL
jgi:hypothetical protein